MLYELKGQDGRRADETRSEHDTADVAASFQAAVVDSLSRRAFKALDQEQLKTLVVCGGVAANRALRERLKREAGRRKVRLVIPPLELCTDNAVMIAGLALAGIEAGVEPTGLGMDAKARSGLSR